MILLEQLENIDRDLFLYLNGFHNPFMDHVMWYISQKWFWIPLYIFFLFYAYRQLGWKGTAGILVSCILCVLVTDQLSVHLFKNYFQRYRPSHNEDIKHLVHCVTRPNGDVYRGGLYGFVSSHAANHMAIATLLWLQFSKFSKYWSLLFIWVAIVSYSRIYLGVHYPADILVGLFLGAIVGWGISLLQDKIQGKLLSS